MERYYLFTDCDLDGVISYLVFSWFHPDAEISTTATTVTRFRDEYLKFISEYYPEHFNKVVILDLDVSEHKDLIDTKNHLIIDHHKTHIDNGNYKEAKALLKEYGSTCKLLYKIFSTLKPEINITKDQKHLVLLGHDYDSYALELQQSKLLNILYWNTQNRFNVFMRDFYKGFKGFNIQQKNIIKQYLVKLSELLSSLDIYKLEKKVQGKPRKILSTFASEAINEVADHLLNKGADIAIVVNINTKRVSFRRNKDIKDINLIEFGKEVCGTGGGHEYAAGGSITNQFMEFTKQLTPYE